MPLEHHDVLIVGAGISGIGAARYMETELPAKSYAVLESREAIGGTWDLFRYPGLRSDSDMRTLGYRFRPWTGEQAIADGPSILSYVQETAAEHGSNRGSASTTASSVPPGPPPMRAGPSRWSAPKAASSFG